VAGTASATAGAAALVAVALSAMPRLMLPKAGAAAAPLAALSDATDSGRRDADASALLVVLDEGVGAAADAAQGEGHTTPRPASTRAAGFEERARRAPVLEAFRSMLCGGEWRVVC
jgi:hypothetical protein